MKILIAAEIYHPQPAGSAVAAYRLATGLAERGHEVSVITSGDKSATHFQRENGVDVYRLAAMSIPFHPLYHTSILAGYLVGDLVKKIKPDVVHIEDQFFICATVAKKAKKIGVPVVATNHFHPDNIIHHFGLPPKIEEKIRNLAWWQLKKVFSGQTLITTPTETARQILLDIGLKKDIRVVSNGIDLKDFKPVPFDEAKESLRKFSIPVDLKRVLFVGRLEKEKGIDILIRALEIVNRQIPTALIVAGTGSEEKSLRDLAQELGIVDKVKLIGRVTDEDLRNLYNSVDIFATASTVELQGLVVMEAMASGLPIVSSHGMALHELISDGENGYVFTNGDYQMAADRMLKILSDPDRERSMAEKSRELIKKHDFEKTLDTYENIYKEVISHAVR